MSRNKKLHQANKAKQDEFYTQMTDIEKEMRHYKHHFKDQIIFCNCDDPQHSNFWRYFELNFKHLGLKRLIATHYSKTSSSYKLELFKERDDDGNEVLKTITTPLKGNGDFRSEECIEALKQSDIVITNPPFSLFREYVSQLIEHDKKFIIIGNQNAITYKEIFPLIKDDKVWLGASIHSGDREFRVPKDYKVRTKAFREDEEGNKYIRVPGVRWFTNLDYEKRHEVLIFTEQYTSEKYPKYDNCDAIEVSKTKEIPLNYDGMMGVPITFLDKYNPKQFEIIRFRKGDDGKDVSINGKCPYFRILIQKRKDDGSEKLS